MSAASSPVEARIDHFKESVRGREVNSDHTLAQYAEWARRFETWYDGSNPTEADVRDFDAYLEDGSIDTYPWENARGRPAPPSYAHATRILAVSSLKLYLRVEHDVRVHTEPQNLVYGEPDEFDPTYLSERNVRETITAARDDCDRPGCAAACAISYDAILRGAELAAVRREDVDLQNGTLYVRSVKGSLSSTLGLGADALGHLREHVREFPDRERLFWNAYGRAWKPQAWNNHFRNHHHEAGSHAFGRHSPIVHRLESAEHSFGDVYQRARHRNPSMTSRYARVVGTSVPDWAGEEG